MKSQVFVTVLCGIVHWCVSRLESEHGNCHNKKSEESAVCLKLKQNIIFEMFFRRAESYRLKDGEKELNVGGECRKS